MQIKTISKVVLLILFLPFSTFSTNISGHSHSEPNFTVDNVLSCPKQYSLTPVSVEGDLVPLCIEGVGVVHYLFDGTGGVKVVFPNNINPAEYECGKIIVTGLVHADGSMPWLEIKDASALSETASTTQSSSAVSGPQNTIVITVRFRGDIDTGHDRAYFNTMIFSDMNNYYDEVSYSDVSFTGDVTAKWYDLPQPRSYYINLSSPYLDALRPYELIQDAITRADPDINYNLYQRVFVVANDAFRGFAFLGMALWNTQEGTLEMSASAQSEWATMGTFAHEMGHQFGLLDLYSYTHPSDDQVFVGHWDLMGHGSKNGGGALPAHVGSIGKISLGWISPSRVQVVNEQQSITVMVNQLETASSGIQAIKIPIVEAYYYLVEVRQQTQYSALPDHGVLILEVDESRPSGSGIVKVVDANESTATLDDAAFDIGERTYFEDPARDVRINIVSALGSSYQIKIEHGPTTAYALEKRSYILDSNTEYPYDLDPITSIEGNTYKVRVQIPWTNYPEFTGDVLKNDVAIASEVLFKEGYWHWYDDEVFMVYVFRYHYSEVTNSVLLHIEFGTKTTGAQVTPTIQSVYSGESIDFEVTISATDRHCIYVFGDVRQWVSFPGISWEYIYDEPQFKRLELIHSYDDPLPTTFTMRFSPPPSAIARGYDFAISILQWDGYSYLDYINRGDFINELRLVVDNACSLTISSSPIAGISLIVDGNSQITPYVNNFARGSWQHIVAVLTVSSGGIVYNFDHWADNYGFSSDISSISYQVPMQGSATLTAYYTRVHDVAVSDIAAQKTIVGQGFTGTINVTVVNQGGYAEDLNVATSANAETIDIRLLTLASGVYSTFSFKWNTTGYSKGNYTINATVDQVPGETDVSDNTGARGVIQVVIPGDINADGIVNVVDAAGVSAHWYPGPPIGPLDYDPNFDINDDEAVNILDSALVNAHWNELEMWWKDDFDYQTLEEMEDAGWLVGSNPYTSFENGYVVLDNDGSYGTWLRYRNFPSAIYEWNAESIGMWVARDYGSMHICVETEQHEYVWWGDAYYQTFAFSRDGVNEIILPGYMPQLNESFVFTLERTGNTFYMFSNGVLKATYTETDETPSRITGVGVNSSWIGTTKFDYVSVVGTAT